MTMRLCGIGLNLPHGRPNGYRLAVRLGRAALVTIGALFCWLLLSGFSDADPPVDHGMNGHEPAAERAPGGNEATDDARPSPSTATSNSPLTSPAQAVSETPDAAEPVEAPPQPADPASSAADDLTQTAEAAADATVTKAQRSTPEIVGSAEEEIAELARETAPKLPEIGVDAADAAVDSLDEAQTATSITETSGKTTSPASQLRHGGERASGEATEPAAAAVSLPAPKPSADIREYIGSPSADKHSGWLAVTGDAVSDATATTSPTNVERAAMFMAMFAVVPALKAWDSRHWIDLARTRATKPRISPD